MAMFIKFEENDVTYGYTPDIYQTHAFLEITLISYSYNYETCISHRVKCKASKAICNSSLLIFKN